MRPTFYGSPSLEKPELDCEIPPDLTKGDSNSSRSYKGRFKFQLILQREIQIPADLTKGDSNSSRSEKGGSNFRRSDKGRLKFQPILKKGKFKFNRSYKRRFKCPADHGIKFQLLTPDRLLQNVIK